MSEAISNGVYSLRPSRSVQNFRIYCFGARSAWHHGIPYAAPTQHAVHQGHDMLDLRWPHPESAVLACPSR